MIVKKANKQGLRFNEKKQGIKKGAESVLVDLFCGGKSKFLASTCRGRQCGCGGGSNSKVGHLEMCDILDLCWIISFTIRCNFLVRLQNDTSTRLYT